MKKDIHDFKPSEGDNKDNNKSISVRKDISDLAYLIKKAKEKGEPKPIVFLGAGVSVSGGIPLAKGIIERILVDFEDKPSVKRLSEEKKSDYYELMSALTAKERRKLFQDYIKGAKVNIAHIYLAQLVKLGYVDYVLTVNFDDLLLRACGLFNYTIPVYDISNVKDFTTTTFQKESIVYLHGQHYGEWLLNARGELDKTKDRISILLNKICHDRTCIVVGYSGEDEVFNEINKFSSFDNELYWVGYLNNRPIEKVDKGLLSVPTKNAQFISGYDADTFFLDLHSKLDLDNPQIIDKPFSFLKSMMDEVTIPEKDMAIDKHKELYKGLSERMDITSKWIGRAINEIQEEDSVEKFKQEVIDAYTKEEFEQNETIFLFKIKQSRFEDAKEELVDFFTIWGDELSGLAQFASDEKLYKLSFEKYKKATELNLENDLVYNNWGNALKSLAEQTQDEILYRESFEKYKKATELNPEQDSVYNNWGMAIECLAKQTQDEILYRESFEKYKKAIELNPEQDSAYNNWGIALKRLAEQTQDEVLYRESFEKYKKVTELNPEDATAYNNWGIALKSLADLTSDEILYRKSFEKYKKATELNLEQDSVYNNWGIAIECLAKQLSDEKLYKLSFEKYKKATKLNPEDYSAYYNWASAISNYVNDIKTLTKKEKEKLLEEAKDKALLAYRYGGSAYNLSCAFALLKDKYNALKYLKESLDEKRISKELVLEDKDWQHYLEDEDFKALMANY